MSNSKNITLINSLKLKIKFYNCQYILNICHISINCLRSSHGEASKGIYTSFFVVEVVLPLKVKAHGIIVSNNSKLKLEMDV